MGHKIPTLGEWEARVLQLVWEHEPCTERQVFELMQEQRDIGRTTVLKTMQRLEAKGLLRREPGRPAQYRAELEEGRVLPELVRRFVDGVLGGSSEPLVAYLAGQQRLTADDVRALKRIAAKISDHARSNDGEKAMADANAAFNDFSSDWLDTMLAVVWQSTLLAIFVALVLRAWRGLSPAVRCWAWRIVALKLLFMPFWIVNVPTPQWLAEKATPVANAGPEFVAAETIAETSVPVEQSNDAVGMTSPTIATGAPAQLSWHSWLIPVWVAVIAIQLVRLGWQRLQLQRLLAAARVADEATHRLVIDGCRQLGLARVPELQIVEVDVSPFVCRLSRPLLVLPESLLLSGETFQLRQIVLHELAHVRRTDLAWCWITHFVRMIYWFHPVAYWVAFRESLERELACDELAMSHSGATAGDYAQTLVAAASRLTQPAVLRAATAAHLDGGRRFC